jgi:protein TonB
VRPEQAVDAGQPEGRPGGVEGGVAGGLVGAVVATPPPTPPPARPPERVGLSVKEPVKLKHVDPIYPDIAQRANVQGVVILECVISPAGRVAELKILRGVPLLDQAALDAVKQWTYKPTLLDGVPVSVVMPVTLQFRLTDGRPSRRD